MQFGILWPSWLPGPSLWSDFTVYLTQLKYLSEGFLPYRDFAYAYPPLFLYSMLPFYNLAGGYAASIPIVLADALTAPVVFLIVRKFSTERVALAAGMAYALSPVSLINEGYIWLSPQPMTLFLLLSVYLLQDRKPVLSSLALAIAVMFKQEAAFVVPAFLVFMVINYRASVAKAAGVFTVTVVGVLSPFLVEAPRALLNHTAYWLPFSPGPSEPSRMAVTVTSQANPIIQTCANTAVPYLYTGSICGDIVNFQAWSQYLYISKIDSIAAFIAPLLFVVFGVGLIAVRRSPVILQMVSAYSCIGGFFLFATLVHGVLAYYFVPVYALILACSTDARSLGIGVIAAILSAIAPEGPFQFIIPTTALFVIAMIQDSMSAGKIAVIHN